MKAGSPGLTWVSAAPICLVAATLLTAACGSEEPASFGGGSCTVDTDCKGDRICEGGKCIDPGGVGGGNGGTGAGAGSGATGGTGVSVHPCGPPSGALPPTPGSGVDTTPPVVTCIGFDKTGYAAGETGHLEYRATDDLSGITDFEGGCWTIESESGNSDINVCGTVEPLGDDLYRLPFEIGGFVESGAFFLARASIHDLADNSFDLSAIFTDSTYEGTSLPVVRTTIGASSTDTTPPVVTQIGFSSPSYQKGTNGYVVYSASDNLSGITDFEGGCWSIMSASGSSSLNACGTVESLGGGSYQLPFEVETFVESGPFYISHASVHDMAGNSMTLSADYEDEVYDGTSIPVARMTVQP